MYWKEGEEGGGRVKKGKKLKACAKRKWVSKPPPAAQVSAQAEWRPLPAGNGSLWVPAKIAFSSGQIQQNNTSSWSAVLLGLWLPLVVCTKRKWELIVNDIDYKFEQATLGLACMSCLLKLSLSLNLTAMALHPPLPLLSHRNFILSMAYWSLVPLPLTFVSPVTFMIKSNKEGNSDRKIKHHHTCNPSISLLGTF